MRLSTLKRLPDKLGIAFSGGVDSSVLLEVARKLKKDITLLTFDHDDKTSSDEIIFAKEVSLKFNIPLLVGSTTDIYPKGTSKEAFWSRSRNNWFKSLDMPVATGHNLNDASEWYLMTSLTGNGGYYMDYSNENVIRPFLTTPKSDIMDYAKHHQVIHINDKTNDDIHFNKRNRVRIELMPKVLEINNGFLNTVKRNIIRKTQ